MLVFNDLVTSPPLYNYSIIENPIPICSMDQIPTDYGCCISSLDKSITFGYGSTNYHYVTNSLNLTISPPVSANNNYYCLIIPNNSSLYPYEAIYIKEKECFQNFECTMQGLNYYSTSNCQGNYSAFDSSLSIYSSLNYSIVLITSGTVKLKWVAQVPAGLFVPGFVVPMEILSLICQIIVLGGYLGLTVYFSLKYYRNKRIKDFGFAFTYLSWLISNIFTAAYAYILIQNDNTLLVLNFVASFEVLPTLFTAMISGSIILQIFKQSHLLLARVLMYGGLVLLFIGLYGPIIVSYGLGITSADLFNFFYPTAPMLDMGWTIFIFVFDMAPAIILLVMICKQYIEDYSKMSLEITFQQLLLHKYWRITMNFIVQLAIMVLYFVIGYIRNQTDWLGGDRNFYAIHGISGLLYLIQNTMVLALYKELRSMTFDLVNIGRGLDNIKTDTLGGTEILEDKIIRLPSNSKNYNDSFMNALANPNPVSLGTFEGLNTRVDGGKTNAFPGLIFESTTSNEIADFPIFKTQSAAKSANNQSSNNFEFPLFDTQSQENK
ncbi:hypothetical protein HK103_003532 [Boothiomyces macroporosus]|uniref:Transmembrane protein n=1 Tax=Boothiomyces macroporosus TaxID=261099 RepID=A0AAD5Y925_9FUNG|nr:hypothetical protein HK103_003532 [Boothiomyces macroporosus]